MSEYRSLYINIRIKEEKLQQFFAEKPAVQPLDSNWIAWWDSRRMYQKQPLTEIRVSRTATNGEVFDELIANRNVMAAEQYDNGAGHWTFVALMYSENYTEILPMLALLKHMATYQGKDGSGVALVYDFYWGDHDVMASMAFEDGQALLQTHTTTDQLNPEILAEANRTLNAVLDRLNEQQFED